MPFTSGTFYKSPFIRSGIKEVRFVENFEKNNSSDDYILLADFENRTVRTNCGDFYYDYSIDFDDFIKFAHFIENEEKRFKICK